MVSKESVDEQISKLGFNLHGWGRAELQELPDILLPGEEIYELVNGLYEGGFALVVATDVRLLLIDKKPMKFLTVEDIRFDMISEIDYSHRLLGAQIHISTGYKDLNFRSYNQPRLRKLIGHVQHCMAASKKQQTQTQVGQSQHLEKINEQLQAYLKAQAEYQIQLQKGQEALQSGINDVPVIPAPAPTHELSDYLFARSLLSQYEAHTGEEIDPKFTDKNKLADISAIQESHSPSAGDLHELWNAGVEEVFNKKNGETVNPVITIHGKKEHFSYDIHPVSIVFSKLPMLIRNKRFARPAGAKLSTETTPS